MHLTFQVRIRDSGNKAPDLCFSCELWLSREQARRGRRSSRQRNETQNNGRWEGRSESAAGYRRKYRRRPRTFWPSLRNMPRLGRSDVRRSLAEKMAPPVPDLTSKDVQDSADGQLKWIVDNGINPSGVPTWKGILSDEEMWKVVHYIRHLPPKGQSRDPRRLQGRRGTTQTHAHSTRACAWRRNTSLARPGRIEMSTAIAVYTRVASDPAYQAYQVM